MAVCEQCGSESFEKHEGFLYCLVCQTQSQEYYEQEYEFSHVNTVTRLKSRKERTKSKNAKVYDDGFWTSWEAFNFILYGMTQDMKKIYSNDNFELVVFKLWAGYLTTSKAAFFSTKSDILPKLGFNFKERDARQLYNIEVMSHTSRTGSSKRRGSTSSAVSSVSNSSSKVQARTKRIKMIKSEHESFLSSSMLSCSNLEDETLESLGRSSDSEMSAKSSKSDLFKRLKEMFKKEDYRSYRKAHKSPKLMKIQKLLHSKKIECLSKNRLLSILHLALILCGSELQLSDLLRFIRESHLSFAKVTHFLPFNFKFPKKDYSYIDSKSDRVMPTHLKQRLILSNLARFLNIKSISTPDLMKLVDRYCDDLNLPDEIGNIAKKITATWMPEFVEPKINHPVPSFEAWAMASIIFVMKLLFGLNGHTELYLSKLAREANRVKSSGDETFFVFEDWQKFVECRKTVLIEFHYPMQEQLLGDDYSVENSKKFLHMLMRESKDEYRKERIIPYSRYFIPEKTIERIRGILNKFQKPQDMDFHVFEPSLTPQKSYLNEILQNLLDKSDPKVSSKAREILQQDFRNCDIDFAIHPEEYHHFYSIDTQVRFSNTKESKTTGKSLDCWQKYWILRYPTKASARLKNFKSDVLNETPKNFQWLITECSRMLEMNTRDVYDELLKLEEKINISF